MAVQLSKISTKAPKDFSEKEAEKKLKDLMGRMEELQYLLYANRTHSLLVVLQGMDTAGKDGTIRRVFSSVNPQGCNVKSFKTPSEEEASHDFLWRVYHHFPEKGMIQVFNRSHYEDILYPAVHKTVEKGRLKERFKVINSVEKHLERNGTIVLKFYLHISEEEQQQRLNERIADPKKRWKYDPNDKTEAKKRDKFIKVYEEIFNKCGEDIPWTIVPADDKWYRNVVIAEKIVNKLEALKMGFPKAKTE